MGGGGRIAQPVGQVRMTNVAVVRLKKGGKRFEIACYKNKVLNWRNGVEKDIDEVLQTTKVYENVSKGKFAKKSDWVEILGVHEDEQACRVILEQGELQISEGERKAQAESMFRDIATIVADKCVNPNSNRPYPFGVIERVMKELHFAVIPNRSAKQQALEVIKKLQKQIPIARAKMKIQVTVPKANGKKIKETLLNEKAEIVQEVWGENARLIVLINPGSYRVVDAMIQENASFNGSLEVLELSVHEEGEHNIDDEISKKTERMGLTDTGAGSFPLAPTAMKMDTASSKEISTTEKKGKQCSTCGGDFGDDVKKYRDHFRSEWHRYNLKLKSRGHPIVDEETFEKLDRADVDKFFETLS